MDLKEATLLVERHYPGKLDNRRARVFDLTPELFGDVSLTAEQKAAARSIFALTPAQVLARLALKSGVVFSLQTQELSTAIQLVVTYPVLARSDPSQAIYEHRIKEFEDAHGWTAYLGK